ncbi:MAG: sensor histidine kinase [Bacteroidales bacterium]
MNKKNKIHVILHETRDIILCYLLSLLVTYIFVGNRLFTNFDISYKGSILGFCLAYLLWKGNQIVGWLIDKKFPWSVDPKKTLVISLICSISYSSVAVFFINLVVYQFIFKINFIGNVPNYIPAMFFELLISELITISFYLAYFFKWWRIATINEEKLKQEAIQLRYDALKSQVNPHFLFNSLSVLTSLVDTDATKAKQFIQQFSDIYRYVLDQRDKELVSLDDEIKFVKSYINLHQIRHDESLTVTIDINDLSGYIIPLSLQTLLENCFKHNIISEEKPLTVKLWREGEFIIVQNNLQKRRIIQDSNGIGLETISKRYEYFSHQPLEITQDENYFTVKVPIVKSIS